jgi:hypothetical protein
LRLFGECRLTVSAIRKLSYIEKTKRKRVADEIRRVNKVFNSKMIEKFI